MRRTSVTLVLFTVLSIIGCLHAAKPKYSSDLQEITGEEAKLRRFVREVVEQDNYQTFLSKIVDDAVKVAVKNEVQVSVNKALAQEVNNIIQQSLTGVISTAVTEALKEGAAVSSGSTYTRWGKFSCPANSSLLYSGEAAGSHYTQTGGSSTLQCLPSSNPEYLKYSDTVDTQAWIYGTEYQLYSGGPLSSSKFLDKNVPCSVCLAGGRGAKVMIPGKITCPDSSWQLEYRGYLMGEHYGHQGRVESVCVDENAEAYPGSTTNHNGALLYHIQTSCITGTLSICPPYVQGRELSCVVCTK